jgi:hypothetical protein
LRNNYLILGTIVSLVLAIPGAILTTTVIPGSQAAVSWLELIQHPEVWILYGKAVLTLFLFGAIVSGVAFKLYKPDDSAT